MVISQSMYAPPRIVSAIAALVWSERADDGVRIVSGATSDSVPAIDRELHEPRIQQAGFRPELRTDPARLGGEEIVSVALGRESGRAGDSDAGVIVPLMLMGGEGPALSASRTNRSLWHPAFTDRGRSTTTGLQGSESRSRRSTPRAWSALVAAALEEAAFGRCWHGRAAGSQEVHKPMNGRVMRKSVHVRAACALALLGCHNNPRTCEGAIDNDCYEITGADCTWTYSDIRPGELNDINNIVIDPPFVAPSHGDLHLAPGSPAVVRADPAA